MQTEPFPIRKRGPKLTERRLAALEKRLGHRLPDDYRAFLLAFNGLVPACEVVVPLPNNATTLDVLYGVKTPDDWMDLEYDLEIMQLRDQGRFPREVIPIGVDGFGNSFALAIAGEKTGEVYFQNFEAFPDRRHDTEWYRTQQFKRIAGSFAQFLAMLKPDEDDE
jgi:hypothetical protein